MARPRPITRLDYFETDAFVLELDRLVIARHEIHVVVPTRPPDDSRLFVRIRRCDTAAVVTGAEGEVPPPRPRQSPWPDRQSGPAQAPAAPRAQGPPPPPDWVKRPPLSA